MPWSISHGGGNGSECSSKGPRDAQSASWPDNCCLKLRVRGQEGGVCLMLPCAAKGVFHQDFPLLLSPVKPVSRS